MEGKALQPGFQDSVFTPVISTNLMRPMDRPLAMSGMTSAPCESARSVGE